ncbi:MAG: hypothetical protein GC129_05935 [Proteobacteria bacterium]|nr:hypothetical protein [Pseudomonadota bacterium]
MMQPTLLDAFIALALVGSVLSACHRGLGREMLHTVMFAIMVTVGIFFMRDNPLPSTQAELARVAISASFYLVAVYVFMWGAMKLLAPLMINTHHPIGLRSRFWAGMLAVVKLLVTIFGLNLWYAVESPYAHPLRLDGFPQVVKDSMLVQLSDRETEHLYHWAARNNLLNYDKVLEKPQSETQKDEKSVEDMFNVGGVLGASPSTK